MPPEDIAERYGADALRYYLMREIPFWSDGSYSEEKLVGRFNHDLGNDLGNLVLRTLSMIERYFQGRSLPSRRHPPRIGPRWTRPCAPPPSRSTKAPDPSWTPSNSTAPSKPSGSWYVWPIATSRRPSPGRWPRAPTPVLAWKW